MGEYELSAVDEEGNALPDPMAESLGPFAGGLASIRTLAPGESFAKTVALSQWALLTKAGTYEVTGTYAYSYAGRRQYYAEGGRVMSPPIRIKLRPRTDDEMAAGEAQKPGRLDEEGASSDADVEREIERLSSEDPKERAEAAYAPDGFDRR
jgi:hypothetical protein